jgi:hypothetical protein
MSGFCVPAGAATDGDEADLQLFIEALGSDDAGKADRGHRAERGRSFYKLATGYS